MAACGVVFPGIPLSRARLGFGRYPPQMQFLMACDDGDVDRLKGKILLPTYWADGIASG